jgi:[ribosomal protein S5]-alanine N-acetyltransferase
MTPQAEPEHQHGIILETDRLTLRRFTDTDADGRLLFELDSDPEVMRFIGPFRLPNVEAYRERIRTVWLPQCAAHPARGVWAMHEKATGEFCGWMFMRPATVYKFAAEAGWTRATDMELGYRLRRTAWGRGFATEAATELVRITLADPTATCIVSAALVPNRGSTRVMEKAGLRRIREFTIPGYADPLVMYAACREGCSPP